MHLFLTSISLRLSSPNFWLSFYLFQRVTPVAGDRGASGLPAVVPASVELAPDIASATLHLPDTVPSFVRFGFYLT